MIVVENLSKTYKIKRNLFSQKTKCIEAVKKLNMNIEEGKIIGLLGVNGAGKTTTIKMLSTLLNPDSGKCTVDGMDLVRDAKKIKQLVNMISGGERMIYWRLTGRENLYYFGKLYGVGRDALKDRVNYLLDFVGLNDRADECVEKYSKGMKQRLQIARGLINDPKYIFMDEPTLGLDAPIAKEIRKKIKTLAQNERKGILLTSHYINEIEELCDYVYIINKGVKVMEGTPKEIIHATLNTYRYLIKIDTLTKKLRNRLNNFIEVTISLDEGEGESTIEIVSNNDIQKELIELLTVESKLLNFTLVEPTLEDSIIKLAGEM